MLAASRSGGVLPADCPRFIPCRALYRVRIGELYDRKGNRPLRSTGRCSVTGIIIAWQSGILQAILLPGRRYFPGQANRPVCHRYVMLECFHDRFAPCTCPGMPVRRLPIDRSMSGAARQSRRVAGGIGPESLAVFAGVAGCYDRFPADRHGRIQGGVLTPDTRLNSWTDVQMVYVEE
jgi:hypothetical protein